jgi:nitrate reductase delta subunit
MSIAVARIIASSLLVYPDQKYVQTREEMMVLANHIEPAFAEPLLAFFNATADLTLEDIQKHYVEIFDMRRKCSLFLTSWTHGDTRNRGMALVYFKEIYKRCGVTITDEELPDHLAVVLEFAALKNPGEGRLLLGEHRAPIELLKDALHSANSYYAFVLDAVVATLPKMTPEIEKRARDLAITGPPQEFVGLSGAVTIALEPFSSRGSDVLQGARS